MASAQDLTMVKELLKVSVLLVVNPPEGLKYNQGRIPSKDWNKNGLEIATSGAWEFLLKKFEELMKIAFPTFSLQTGDEKTTFDISLRETAEKMWDRLP